MIAPVALCEEDPLIVNTPTASSPQLSPTEAHKPLEKTILYLSACISLFVGRRLFGLRVDCVSLICGLVPIMSTPRSPRDIDDSASDGSDSENEQQLSLAALEKQKFLARREVEFDVPDEVWLQERRCLLMLLEARMLLREMVEYKVKMMRTASGNLTIAEIQNLLALYSENDEDADFISGTLNITFSSTYLERSTRYSRRFRGTGSRCCVGTLRPIRKTCGFRLPHRLSCSFDALFHLLPL